MCIDGNTRNDNNMMNDGGDGNGPPSFTLAGLSKEYHAGDIISLEDAKKIVAASNGQLQLVNGHIVGHNPDGSGDVDIDLSKPLDEGQIHDLHHTVPGSGGVGNSMNM